MAFQGWFSGRLLVTPRYRWGNRCASLEPSGRHAPFNLSKQGVKCPPAQLLLECGMDMQRERVDSLRSSGRCVLEEFVPWPATQTCSWGKLDAERKGRFPNISRNKHRGHDKLAKSAPRSLRRRFCRAVPAGWARRVSGFDRPSPPISMLISTRATRTWVSLPKSYGEDGS